MLIWFKSTKDAANAERNCLAGLTMKISVNTKTQSSIHNG